MNYTFVEVHGGIEYILQTWKPSKHHKATYGITNY